MTSYFIDTVVENTAEDEPTLDLTGNDSLLLSPTGQLVATGEGGTALTLDSGGNNNIVLLDGTVMSSGDGIDDSSTFMNLTLNGTVSAAGVGLSLDESGVAYITIGASGVMDGANIGILADSNNTQITNLGTVSGVENAIIMNGTGTIVNDGTIVGESALLEDSAGLTFTNNGLVSGTIEADNASNLTLTNNGTIAGAISLIAGDTLVNTGTISGNVSMGTGETLDNTGIIHGTVTFAGGTNVLDTRHGEITGTVTGGSGSDTFIAGSDAVNFIGGSGTEVLTGGAGDDVITAGSGKDTITGGKGDDLLTAGSSRDTFAYNGNFGNDTIVDFNTKHDIIHFAANDFAGYTALEAHMVQAGTDVVITLDANDSIVLTHETLANFTSSDFTFG